MITSLAYLGVGSPNKDEWPRMATGMWGAMVADPGPDGAVRIKIDDAPWRIQIHPADQDETRYIGWGVDWEEDLDAVDKALADAGITARHGDADLAAARDVNRILFFTDPWGFRHEVTWGRTAQRSTFRPGRAISGFVTGQQGLGHVLLLMPDIEEGHRFFTRLGFRLSDKIIVPGRLNARFYHCNARHHTLALGQCPPGVAGLNHLMIQVGSLDDVGTGYEIAQQMGIPITLTLGRHTNDQQFSFYHSTPSSFHVEYGFGGLEVDEETWVPKVYDRTAVWGHAQHPDGQGRPPGIMHPLAERPARPADTED
ncbi:VOC family protein [Streptomyces carpinensis]|uniref:VOC family protein n=1 Tax=Streptomyces carpinensis TaxID=66369 RepID=A0ABV1W5R5_9ACTN|nr:VOC family protein [Streptomyces carpinensis]